jgi:hypothetical protein
MDLPRDGPPELGVSPGGGGGCRTLVVNLWPYTRREDRTKSTRSGFHNYLAKPSRPIERLTDVSLTGRNLTEREIRNSTYAGKNTEVQQAN